MKDSRVFGLGMFIFLAASDVATDPFRSGVAFGTACICLLGVIICGMEDR